MTKIVQLAPTTLRDIPKVLRAIADQVEIGEYGTVSAGVVSLECATGVLEIFGAGAADNYRALAISTGTQHILTQRIFGVCADPD